MSKILAVRQGESLPFSFDRGENSIDGFVCTINVKQFPEDVATISRVITPTEGVWSGLLTSAEIDTLVNIAGHNLWWLIAVLTSASTDEEEQIATGSVRFSLVPEWAQKSFFIVLDSEGNSIIVALSVLDADLNQHIVLNTVLDSDGNSFNVI